MRTVFVISILSLFAFASENCHAESCNRTVENFFCIGDSVISLKIGEVYLGTVMAMSNSKIQVKTSSWGNGNTTLEAEPDDLYLTTGCIKLNCVGDDIYLQDFSRKETILGLNPLKNSMVYTRSGGWAGASIEFANLSFGCSDGVCVGDKASKILPGRIIGIVPNHAEIVVFTRNDYFRVETAWTKELYISELTSDYTAEQRKKPIYPEIDETKYLIPDFKFSYERPIKK